MFNLVFAIVFIVFGQCIVGHTFEIEPRIVRGYSGRTGQFPYFALLIIQPIDKPGQKSFSSRCGATLISDQWLITAAHCLDNAQKLAAHFGISQIVDSEPGHKMIPAGRENFYFPSQYMKTPHWIDMGSCSSNI